MAETTRKWVGTMDTKAAFISTLNAGLLTFIWTGAKLEDKEGLLSYLGLFATLCSLTSLFVSLRVILPKSSLRSVLGKTVTYAGGYKPISFYGFIAENFPKDKHEEFIKYVNKMDEEALAMEALEQHYTISHVVYRKAKLLTIAGYIFKLSLIVTVFTLALKKVF